MRVVIKTTPRVVEVKEFRTTPTGNYVVLEAPDLLESFCVGDKITLKDVLMCDIPLLSIIKHWFTGEPLQFTPESESESL